jgi:hypothetical protein
MPVMATISVVAGTMTLVKTRARAPHSGGLKLLVDTFFERWYLSVTMHPPTLPNTLGSRTPVYGSRTTGLPTRVVAWIMITSSSAISSCTWLTRPGHGWST